MKRAFYWSSKAYYRDVIDGDQVMFGMYAKDGGTDGEMTMRWIKLDSNNVPRLEIFDDAWETLASFGDLICTLAKHDDQNITPEEFVAILKAHGFEDFTPYDNPYAINT